MNLKSEALLQKSEKLYDFYKMLKVLLQPEICLLYVKYYVIYDQISHECHWLPKKVTEKDESILGC